MKKHIKKYIIVACTVTGLISGCEKNFLDVNDNPNAATEATPNLLLSAGLNRTAAQLSNSLNVLGAIWVGQIAPPTDYLYYINEKQYNITSSFYTGIWDTGYDILNDFQRVETLGAQASMPNYVGIAKIMKAYNFQIIVDAYNNVPYSEALKGTDVIRPKYEQGQQVYENLIKLLDEGIAAIKTAPTTATKPTSDDIIFKGNMTLWIKFANTIKLRMLLRQSEISGRTAYIQGEMAKIVAEGSGFLNAGESALSNPGYLSSTGKLNPFWETYYQTAAGTLTAYWRATKATDYVLGKYDSYADPRKAVLYATVSGNYKGVALGYPTGSPTASQFTTAVTSGLLGGGGILKSATGAVPILTASESLFLQAEAAQRGFLSANAATLYASAVRESFSYFNVPNAATAATTYLAQTNPNVNFASSTDKIQTIIVQKWLALNVIGGWELWNDFRRTKFPSDNPLSQAAITPKHPARLLYPNSELGTNGAEVTAQGTINPFDSKIFWDKK